MFISTWICTYLYMSKHYQNENNYGMNKNCCKMIHTDWLLKYFLNNWTSFWEKTSSKLQVKQLTTQCIFWKISKAKFFWYESNILFHWNFKIMMNWFYVNTRQQWDAIQTSTFLGGSQTYDPKRYLKNSKTLWNSIFVNSFTEKLVLDVF